MTLGACHLKDGLHLELCLYVLHCKIETNEWQEGDNDSYGDKSPYEIEILVSLGNSDCITESRQSFTTVLWK